MHFVDMSAPPFVTENARCLNTKQDSSIHKHKGESSGVLVETGPRAILTPERLKKRQNGRRMKEPEEPMFTITATDRHGVVYHGRIRRLVPRECLRLQGYYDSQIDLMTVDMSDRQLYKQAGNGVTVNVVEAIGRNLKAVDEELKLEVPFMPIDLRDQYFGTEIEMTGITRSVRHRWWQRCSVRTIIIGFV